MRILVVGAGAIGGYFGGRLLDAGRDVTFLVRERRAERLAQCGLKLRSALGDLVLECPPTILSKDIAEPFDIILLSCKAYDLEGAIESVKNAVGPDTVVVPLLNGMRHLDVLDAHFGADKVLGGQCVIAATLDAEGEIVHLNKLHSMTIGERSGERTSRIEAIAAQFDGAGFEFQVSADILQSMWEKWVFLATLASGTCLMRAPIGDILAAPGGEALLLGLFDECSAVAADNGHAPGERSAAGARTTFTEKGSLLTASMLRDLENNAAIEADHIVGDLLARRKTEREGASLLAAACTHLKAYEARRARTGQKAD
ncbi:2-dehydropantoate 2-reductase [Caballeronia humi]|uniref:2-dehydropantoate 2-reductase n=1 Tax=Caballeronia humi TaxID=326474 RepID=A0A158IMC9_9BURK|nr:2-dehydropantoate 2-reductase [Caballeronia humi]SAL57231.1 2-dehydropantoate 2-reductase [Caballeronia humi]